MIQIRLATYRLVIIIGVLLGSWIHKWAAYRNENLDGPIHTNPALMMGLHQADKTGTFCLARNLRQNGNISATKVILTTQCSCFWRHYNIVSCCPLRSGKISNGFCFVPVFGNIRRIFGVKGCYELWHPTNSNYLYNFFPKKLHLKISLFV